MELLTQFFSFLSGNASSPKTWRIGLVVLKHSIKLNICLLGIENSIGVSPFPLQGRTSSLVFVSFNNSLLLHPDCDCDSQKWIPRLSTLVCSFYSQSARKMWMGYGFNLKNSVAQFIHIFMNLGWREESSKAKYQWNNQVQQRRI